LPDIPRHPRNLRMALLEFVFEDENENEEDKSKG
jgi:hypothetical protein